MQQSLHPLFEPRTIAIIGASDNVQKFGGRPIRYMGEAGYTGKIFPVNPKGGTIQGLTAYKDIRDVPEPVDMTVISVPAPGVVEAVRNCAEAGVKSAVIFSSGFAEVGGQGQIWQDEIAAIARDSGMRVVGPNCMGTLDVHSWAIGTFTSAFEHGWPKAGSITIISQSGAVGAHTMVLARERGLGIRGWVTTGNECDVDVAACIAYCAEDPKTRVIAAYVEGTRNPALLMQAMEAARRNGKAVIMLKVGASDVGAIAASSHTASLAGADAVFDAALRQCGAYRAKSLEELLDMAAAASTGRLPTGNRLGIVTISGGAGVLTADAAVAHGLEVPELPAVAQKAIKDAMSFAAPRNPVDTTAEMLNNMPLFEHCMRTLLEHGKCDAVTVFLSSTSLSERMMAGYRDILPRLRQDFPDALVFLNIICRREDREFLEGHGYVIMEDPTRAVGVIAGLLQIAEGFKRAGKAAPPALPQGARAPAGSAMSEREAATLLADAGIPVIDSEVCADADAAAAAADRFGYPVVLKIVSGDIAHKSDIGGVRLNVADAGDVRAAFGEITQAAADKAPDARIDGILVAPMAGDGVEAIVGVHRDPTFGPVVMFGLGGVHVEVLEDVTFRIAPFGVDEARRMIDEIRGRKLLDGVRGAPPADIDALAQTIATLSVYADTFADDIEGIDINPLLVRAKGQGTVALDALVLPAAGPKA